MYNNVHDLNWKMYCDILRELRNDNELSQTQVAKVLKTTQQVYSRYEKGVNEIPIRHIMTLAIFYGVSTDYILGLTSDPDPYARR